MAPSNVENFSPHVIKQISKELHDLTQNPMEGVRILFDEEDVTNVQAIIDGPPGTPYFNGSFRIRLVLGKNFPVLPPKGFFVTKIFHPNVGRSGEICVNTLKKDWKQDLGIKHILLTIKCLLIVPNPESALNEEAGKMLLEQYEDYCRRAKMMTEIHAPKVELTDNNEESCSQSPSIGVMVGGNNNNDNSDATNDKAASTSTSTKNTRDLDRSTTEPASKRLNLMLDCCTASPSNEQNQQQPQPLSSQQSSQVSSISSSSSQTSMQSKIAAKNRGLKRVLRLRS